VDVSADVMKVVSHIAGTDVSPDQPLMDAGVDSLAAVEVRNSLATLAGAELPATIVFDYPSVNAIAAGPSHGSIIAAWYS
jgi:acyl carrier protein